ncbi:hypothetical protein [Tichowtungia aerotolerans]|uniref:HlyD family secretion protein n=1 Tax=Tichowtungia aerotolerans TaxID=2697043 RepID=A0A6P1MF23_9BACT|nr:hypothetical protein [Tichowtungia aerotolerans]QHI70608.1 hypothetical protein GT409_14555 [Tichowtungia aerotolerans]
MAKSRFDRVKGTKDFLVAGVICIFLCLWAIRDAWFPTKKVLEKHPLTYPVTVAVSGVVKHIPVNVGDSVAGSAPLLTLQTRAYEEAVEAAEEAYKDVQGEEKDVLLEKLNALVQARENLKATTVACSDFMLKTTHGEDPLQGKVLEILAEPATEVEAGETVMLIQPKDTFYIFNKTLAVFSFILAAVFLFFHRVASR